MQVHRTSEASREKICYFSRVGKEHGEGSSYNVLDPIVELQVVPKRCILDGELVVWNKVA